MPAPPATRRRWMRRTAIQRLAELIDTQRDYPAATALVRQLMFQEKLLHDIDDALDAVTS